MHRTLENKCVGNTRVTPRVHRVLTLGEMQLGQRMRNHMVSKLKLTPLVGALRVDVRLLRSGTTPRALVGGMASHPEVLSKEAA